VAGRFCTDILASLSHPAVLVPTQRGLLTVAVTGMREPGSRMLTVTRTVMVR
jgi:hypothetical protein